MSRITKELSKEIAKRLAEPKKKIIDELKRDLKNFITEKYRKTLPEKVLNFPLKEYLKESHSIHVTGKGLYRSYFAINKLPCAENGHPYLSLSDEDSEYYQKTEQKIDKLKGSYNSLLIEIEAMVFSFRTFKKAKEMFPECEPFLPQENESFLPSINVDKIREALI